MTTLDVNCPICSEGYLRVCVDSNQLEYKGQTTELVTQYSTCNSCGCEQATEDQMRTNKRATIAFKKKVDGLLTGIEVRNLRKHFGINQVDAAKIFGGGPVAFSKYESDDLAQSKAMDNLLRVAYEESKAFVNLANKAGVKISCKGMNKGVVIGLDELFAGEWISVGMEQSPSTLLRVYEISPAYMIDSEWEALVLPENELKKSA